MFKKLCTYLLASSILVSTVLSPLQTYAMDFEPATTIELNESTEELLNNEEENKVDIKENLQSDIELEIDNNNIIDEEIVDNEENTIDLSSEDTDNNDEIIPDSFAEDKDVEEDFVDETIIDIEEDIVETPVEDETSEVELFETELTEDIDGYTVTATGNMPENAELKVSVIEYTEDLESQVNDTLPEFEKFTVYRAFDIDILVDGEKWQPVDFDELVSISIKNIDVSEIKEEAFADEVVFNFETEEVEEIDIESVNDTVFRVENEKITELFSTTNDDEVVFETEHFTTFIIGGVNYDTDTATATYQAGDNITAYWFENNKTLAFVGTGDMYGFENFFSFPWNAIRTNITDIYLDDRIKSIASGAFYDCTNLVSVNALPSGLTTIGNSAFRNCTNLKLTGSLPSGLTQIGSYAFYECTNLKLTGSLPSGLTEIGDWVFGECTNLALTGSLPSGLTTIGDYTFRTCPNLALSGTLPSGLTEIGEQAFYNCNKLALTGSLPSGLTRISYAAFHDCRNLALSGTLPSGLTQIGNYAFYNCANLTLTGSLPSGLTTIGNSAFRNCTNLKLTGSLPSGLTSIGNSAFRNCTNLKLTGSLPSGLTSIGNSAFRNCTNLKLTGSLPSGLTKISTYAFNQCPNLALSGTLPSGLTEIGEQAFTGCKNLALTGELPSGLTSIGGNAFFRCENLALTGSLPSGLTTIGNRAFSGCNKLALTGSLPSGLTTIGFEAFENCKNLALSGTLPSGLTEIGNTTFCNCENLALEGSLPSGLTQIGNSAFRNCTNLKLTGSLPSGLTSIGNSAFRNCTNLKLTGSLPSGLTSIGSSAFSGCENLALTGSLPSGLTEIGGGAFISCTNLALTGELPSGLTDIGEDAFTGVDVSKTHFNKNLSGVNITSTMQVPTTYTVVDTFSDGKASVTTTKYGYVGATSLSGTAPTYEEYTLKTDCEDAPITIGKEHSDRLTLRRVYEHTPHTVTFTDYNGDTLSTETVSHGNTATKPVNPTRDGSTYGYGDADYTFKEWQLNGVTFDFNTAITEDITLVASYYEPIRIYLSAGEGYYENKNTGSHIDTLDFYVTPSKNLAITLPINWKEAQRFGYELQGYKYGSGESYSVLPFTKNEITIPNGGSMTFTADWGTPVEYSLTYNYGDGTAPTTPNRASYNVTDNVNISNEPTAPEHYKFLGFTATLTDAERTPVLTTPVKPLWWNEGSYAQDMIINAEYTNKDVYKITVWVDKAKNEKMILSVEEGDSISKIDVPEKTGYTLVEFRDSDNNVVSLPHTPTSNEEIEVVWSKNPVATFNAGNGIFANKEHIVAVPTDSDGKVLSTPIPTYKGHTFSHWEVDGVAFNPKTDKLLSDKEVKAVWNANDIVFNFFDANNTVFRTYVLKYGDNVASKVDVPAPKKTGYTLTGWNNAIPTIAEEDTDFYPNFRINTYTIKFVDALDNTIISTKSYTYGSTVDMPTAPAHTGYTFTTWSPAVTKVSEDITYKAIYSRNGYTVTFMADNKELAKNVYFYGDTVAVPTAPTKAGYNFSYWTPTVEKVCKANATYTAVYTPNTYNITFKDYDGELISSKAYNSGDRINVPKDPTRDGYTFDGWSPEVSKTADADATYKATYTKKEPVVTPDPIKPDVTPVTPTPTPVTPAPEVKEETKPKTPVEEEVEEEEEDDEPEEIKVVIPDKSDNEPPKTVEAPKKTYKITFVDDEGNVISAKFYKEGEVVSIPDAPDKENYEFTNWSPAFSTKAVADAEYKPVYKEVKKEEPVAPAPEEPVDKPKTPIQKAVPAIVAGVVTTGILATGYFSGLWLFLANLLFVKRRKKWHGLLNIEENSFVKNILDESEDEVYIEDVWAKSNGNVDDFIENMKSLKTATLLPVGTRMFIYLGDGVDVVEYKDADEKKFFDALKDNLDAFGKVTLELRHDKFSVDIEVTFEAQVR